MGRRIGGCLVLSILLATVGCPGKDKLIISNETSDPITEVRIWRSGSPNSITLFDDSDDPIQPDSTAVFTIHKPGYYNLYINGSRRWEDLYLGYGTVVVHLLDDRADDWIEEWLTPFPKGHYTGLQAYDAEITSF